MCPAARRRCPSPFALPLVEEIRGKKPSWLASDGLGDRVEPLLPVRQQQGASDAATSL